MGRRMFSTGMKGRPTAARDWARKSQYLKKKSRARLKITEEATLESLGIDSLDMVELICDLEEKCDVEFGEPEGIETVGQLVAHIDSL